MAKKIKQVKDKSTNNGDSHPDKIGHDATQKDYARLGRTLETVLRRDYINVVDNWKRFVLLSFVRGLFAGLGGVLGATLLLALLIWILSVFDNIPLIGDLFESIRRSIESSN